MTKIKRRPLGLLTIEDVTLDLDKREVWIRDGCIKVGATLYDLLECLFCSDGLVTHKKLLAVLRPDEFQKYKNDIPVHIRNNHSQSVGSLRRMLKKSDVTIETVLPSQHSIRPSGYIVRGQRVAGWNYVVRQPSMAAE